MNRPCSNCPFLRSQAPLFMLCAARKREIARALRTDGSFPCHKTVDYRAGDGRGRVTKRSRFCVGALLTMDKELDGGMFANFAARIAALCRQFDPAKLEGRDLVFASLREWEQTS